MYEKFEELISKLYSIKLGGWSFPPRRTILFSPNLGKTMRENVMRIKWVYNCLYFSFFSTCINKGIIVIYILSCYFYLFTFNNKGILVIICCNFLIFLSFQHLLRSTKGIYIFCFKQSLLHLFHCIPKSQ